MTYLINMLSAFWETAQAMAPWLLFGFLAAGVLSLFVSPALVCRFLGRAVGKKAVTLAVLLGVPLPLCSCGVLPLAASLKRGGASKGAMAAFLISTPQTGIDSFFATGSLLGWVFALVRPLVATITGLAGGFAIQAFDDEPLAAPATATTAATQHHGLLGKLLAALQYGYGTLLKSVAPALLVGLIISALILVVVPDSFFDQAYLGNDWVAFPAMLLIGMPMYVCSTASIPVALAFMAKGISPGAALIFLIMGPTLSGASLAMLLQLLGKKCMAVYLLTISAAAVLAGIALNAANAGWHLLPDYTQSIIASCNSGCATDGCAVSVPFWRPACAILLFLLLTWHLVIKRVITTITARKTIAVAASDNVQLVVVKKMRCEHCRNAVFTHLQSYPQVTEVTRVDNETFRVTGALPETLAADIQKLGFELAE